MYRTHTKTIRGLQFSSNELPTMRSLALFPRLMAILAPVLPALLKSGGLAELDFEALGPGAKAACMALAADPTIYCELLSATSVVVPDKSGNGVQMLLGSADAINTALPGKPRLVLEACFFAMQVNFRDFFASGDGPAS